MAQSQWHIVIPAFHLFAMLKIKYSRSNNIFFIIQLPKAERNLAPMGSYTLRLFALGGTLPECEQRIALIDLFYGKTKKGLDVCATPHPCL